MAKTNKLIQKILQGRSDAGIGFEELRSLLKSLGFEERVRGSHPIFHRADVEERLNPSDYPQLSKLLIFIDCQKWSV